MFVYLFDFVFVCVWFDLNCGLGSGFMCWGYYVGGLIFGGFDFID